MCTWIETDIRKLPRQPNIKLTVLTPFTMQEHLEIHTVYLVSFLCEREYSGLSGLVSIQLPSILSTIRPNVACDLLSRPQKATRTQRLKQGHNALSPCYMKQTTCCAKEKPNTLVIWARLRTNRLIRYFCKPTRAPNVQLRPCLSM